MPSDIGTPYVIRLPLGIVPYRPPSSSFLESTKLSDWLASGVNPAEVSDPRGSLKALKRVARAVLKDAAHFGPF